MNITPNSFSDPGINLSESGFRDSLNLFIDNHVSALDFGAESTAPKNAGLVDEVCEWERLEKYFFPMFAKYKSHFQNVLTISLDTYRFETFDRFFKKITTEYALDVEHITFVWNDVSGVHDQSIDSFLQQYRKFLKAKKVKYVASFTFVEKRERASFHMDYVDHEIDIVKEFYSFIDLWTHKFLQHQVLDSLIVDPAFGFSKNYEQNYLLLDALFLRELKAKNILIGLSRKSFLRKKLVLDNPELASLSETGLIEKSESLHRDILIELLSRLKKQKLLTLPTVYLRIHDPQLAAFLLKSL